MSAPQHPGQQPGQYHRPGETEYIPRVSDAPRREEPFRFVEDKPDPDASPAWTWTMRVLGLLAVAVLSGAVYWYVNDKPAGTSSQQGGQQTQVREGIYDFTPHPEVQKPKVDSDCKSHAYGKVKEYLAEQNTCERVTQALYTTTVDGRTAYVSVSVVHMVSEEKAHALRELTKKNGTGNVSDLVKEKVVKVEGLTSLANGYDASEAGETVTIVEADFSPKGPKEQAKSDKETLDKICGDALRLGPQIDAAS